MRQVNRRGYDRVESVMFVVGRKVNMLSKVEGGKKRKKLRGEVICRIIEMNVKVAGDDEFMRCGILPVYHLFPHGSCHK